MTSAAVEIAAPAQVVWSLVSDLTRMGEWSPETERVEWTGTSTGPAVGATFKGHNRFGKRQWTTNGRITVAEPPRELAWEVTAAGGLKVAEWRYRIEELDDLSCRLTESTVDRRGRLIRTLGGIATGVHDRGTHNAEGIRATLERIKAAAEPRS